LNNPKNKVVKKPGKTKAFFICLLIASFLWIVHALNTVYTQNFKIPVSFKNLPQNKRPLEPLPERISVDVKASGLKLSLLMLNKPFNTLEIDFNNLKSFNRNQCYVLSASRLNLNSIFKLETQIKQVSPDSLYFSENTGFQKTVPVKVPLFINCKQGYGYLKPIVNPAFMSIWGDTAEINKIDTIYCNPIHLNQLNDNVEKTVSIIKPFNNIYSTTNEVRLNIAVSKLIEQSIVIPIKSVREIEEGKLNIFPPTAKVRFTALQNNLDQTDTSLFKALIDHQKPNKNNKKYSVFLGTVPSNVTIMDIEPKEVEILIFK